MLDFYVLCIVLVLGSLFLLFLWWTPLGSYIETSLYKYFCGVYIYNISSFRNLI